MCFGKFGKGEMKMPNTMYLSRIAVVLLHTIVATLCEENAELFFKLTLPGGSHRIRLGHTVVLDCEAGGAPSPTIHWRHNGKIITQVGLMEDIYYFNCKTMFCSIIRLWLF